MYKHKRTMRIQSKSDAFEILSKYRGHLIARARYEAALIATSNGNVHSRLVRNRMESLGLLHPDIDERWIGCLFPGKYFEWTKEYLEVRDSSPRTRPGGLGGRPIRLWRLKPGVKLPDMPEWNDVEVHTVRLDCRNSPSSDEMLEAIQTMDTMRLLAGEVSGSVGYEKVRQWLQQMIRDSEEKTCTLST